MKPMRGLTLQLLRVLMQAGICAIVLLVCVIQCSNFLISRYFTGSDFQREMTERRVEKLAEYVVRNRIASTDFSALQKWCDRQPLVLLEVYRGNYLVFNSNYYEEPTLSDQYIEVVHYDWYSYYEVPFADGTAELLIYSDEAYVLQTIAKLLGLALAGVLFIIIVLHGIKKAICYIYLLTDEIGIMGNGDLSHPISIEGRNELTLLAQGLDQTRRSLATHRQNEEKIIRQNQEMITELSHDLRTPLTKIMLCVEIIQSRKYHNEQELNDYLSRTYNSALQLKAISEHILEYSLSQSRSKELQIRTLRFQDAFFEIVSEMTDYFISLGFEVECDLEWGAAQVEVIDLNVRRVFDNIVSNIEKYADRAAPVLISSVQKDEYAGFVIRNKKKDANTLEGHHVGLSALQSSLNQMGGTCETINADGFFSLKILFHLTKQ